MADGNRNAVNIVAILAIVIIVGLVIYFVMEETDDTIEIDLGGALYYDVPAHVVDIPVASNPRLSVRV